MAILTRFEGSLANFERFEPVFLGFTLEAHRSVTIGSTPPRHTFVTVGPTPPPPDRTYLMDDPLNCVTVILSILT